MSPWKRQGLLQRGIANREGLVSSPPSLLAMIVLACIGLGVVHRKLTSDGYSDPLVTSVSVLTYPFQWGASRLEANISLNWDWLFAKHELSQQNLQLQAENARLKLENESLMAKAQEADRLQAALAFAKSQPKPPLVAPVIGWLPSPHFDTITIGLGTHNGVKSGSIVRTADGLVGQVFEVSPFTAQVLLLSDNDSRVHVILYRNGKPSGPVGVVQGQGRDRGQYLRAIYFKLEDDVKVGDVLKTSGYGGIFPPDIPVGTITEVSEDKVRFLKETRVIPYAPLASTLREVLVMR